MKNYHILNTREIKILREKLTEQFGYFPEEDYAYLQTEKNRIFITTKDLAKLNLDHLIVDRIGLYFAELMENGSVRLSKEGVQLFWREVQRKKKTKELKNAVELSKEEVQKYFQGEDLEKDLGEKARFVLLQYQKSLLGCGRYKNGKILNFLPKMHRGEVIV